MEDFVETDTNIYRLGLLAVRSQLILLRAAKSVDECNKILDAIDTVIELSFSNE